MGTTAQPRIVHKLLVRTAILLFALAAVFLGVRWVNDYRAGRTDLGGHVDTTGMIVAIQDKDEGSQAVIFKPDGSIVPSPDYETGKVDREAAWQPDGERVFFSSDRKSGDFHIFRWNPGSGEVTEKSKGSSSQSTPFFATKDTLDASGQAIITSRGYVLEFDTAGGETHQLLPPKQKEIGATEEGGQSNQFEVVYHKFGNSFLTARWLKGRKWIAAVMQADDGQTLIVENMEATTEKEAAPRAVAAGEKIDIDVDPSSGKLIYAVRNYRTPDAKISDEELIKDPEAVKKKLKPFKNAIGAIDPDDPASHILVARSDDNNAAFAQPAVDPTGSRVMFVEGHIDESGSFIPNGLMICPLQLNGGTAVTPLIKGDVYEPSWSPGGELVAYIKRANGKRGVWTCRSDGSDERNLSGDKGDFAFPKFSPMISAAH